MARHRHAGRSLAWEWTLVGLAAAALYVFGAERLSLPELSIASSPRQVLQAGSTLPGRQLPICGNGHRANCIVDGDTLWLDGEKIRIENINAPEVEGACSRETKLARQATERLRALTSYKPLSVDRNGTDRYGRTLATLSTSQGDVGEAMVDARLAHRWRGRKQDWCA